MSSIYQFTVRGITGEEINFADYRGKKLLLVNVASECGYTPQYQQLQELYEVFRDKLEIVAFPCNDFGGQEPGAEEDIAQFCTRRYGVEFPLTAKINILGATAHPVYRWLKDGRANGVMDTQVMWNFTKYLLDEEGRLVDCLPAAVSPFDDRVLGWLNS